MTTSTTNSLFSDTSMPKKRIPLSKERIEEAKKLMEQKDYKGVADKLRDIREGLEDYERRIK